MVHKYLESRQLNRIQHAVPSYAVLKLLKVLLLLQREWIKSCKKRWGQSNRHQKICLQSDNYGLYVYLYVQRCSKCRFHHVSPQAQALVKSTVNFVSEVLGEEDDIPEAAELRKQRQQIEDCRKETEEQLTNDTNSTNALRLALQMVEMLLFLTVKTELAGQCATSLYLTTSRQQSVMSRIGEILWTVKDALELARDLEDLAL